MQQISLTLRSWFSGFVQYLSKCFNVHLKLGHGIWCNIPELVSLISYKIISDLHASAHSSNLSAPLDNTVVQWDLYHDTAELFEEFCFFRSRIHCFLQLLSHSSLLSPTLPTFPVHTFLNRLPLIVLNSSTWMSWL